MFERAVIFSALLVFTTFMIVTIKFFQFTGLEVESPVVVLREIFPEINTTDN